MEQEDILSDSLHLFGGPAVIGDEENAEFKFGELVFKIAPKEGKAHTLLADQLFSPSLLLTERIDRGLIPLSGLSLLELGAGCALPSLLAATLSSGAPSLVVITDYPASIILDTLEWNVDSNKRKYQPECQVLWKGYEWGSDTREILDLVQTWRTKRTNHPADPGGYDVLILSDLLYYNSSHPQLLNSLTTLLARKASSRAYVAAGKYTPPDVCDSFLRQGEEAGLVWEEGTVDEEWKSELIVSRLTKEDMDLRKANVRWWTARWRLGDNVL